MARPELGLKRHCMNCGAKFYDLARDPATCPKCGTIYQAAASAAPSRVAAPAIASRPQREDDEVEADPAGAELVSLEEADAAEGGAEAGDDVDLDEEAPSAPDDTFLEEEEEGEGDVSDLIDGDIENEEET